MPEQGELLADKYRILRVLGEGGMGAVYEAKHERIGKRVAVKMLRPEMATNEQLVNRFAREAEAAAAIGHPAIIDIYDIGNADDGSLFLVMEYLQGESLGELLDREKRLDPSFLSFVVCQVLSALGAAHSKGIVHRDLKPDNIFLVDTGQALPEIKLLDFGISKITDLNNPDNRLTATGDMMGTPYYMSPEQAVGGKDIDHLADIYAMGVILYEGLCGRRPFEGDNMLALVQEVLHSYPQPPSTLRSDLPPNMENVIQYSMAKDKGLRYQSAAHMLDELLPFVDETAQGRLTLGKVEGLADPPTRIDPTGPFKAAVPTPGGPGLNPQPHPSSQPGLGSSHPDTAMAWQAGAHSKSRPSRGAKIGLIAGASVGLLLLIVGIGALVVLLSPDEQAPPPPPVSTPVDPSKSQASSPSPTPEPISTITVTLRDVPEGARVLVDGEPIDGVAFERQRDVLSHTVRVELEGYQPWEQSIAFDQNFLIAVSMEQVEEEDQEEREEREERSSRREERSSHREREREREQEPRRESRDPRSRFGNTFE